MPALALPPPVQHGQRLDFDGLKEEARKAISRRGMTQDDVGALLGISQAAVSAALNDREGKRAGTLVRIIEELTAYRIAENRSVEYRVERKGCELGHAATPAAQAL